MKNKLYFCFQSFEKSTLHFTKGMRLHHLRLPRGLLQVRQFGLRAKRHYIEQGVTLHNLYLPSLPLPFA